MKNADYINNHPISLIIALLSNIILIYLIYIFLSYSSVVTIYCDKNNIQDQYCKITSNHLIYNDESTYKLADIEKMDAHYYQKPDADFIHLSIITKNKEKQIDNILNGFAFTVPEGKFLLAAQFNSFLADQSQKTFERQYSNTQTTYICTGLLVVFTVWSIIYCLAGLIKKL